VEVPGKVGPVHLSIGDDVDAGFGHVHERHVDGVAQRLGDVRGAKIARGDGVAEDPDPARNGVTADDLGRQQGQVCVAEHRSPSSPLRAYAIRPYFTAPEVSPRIRLRCTTTTKTTAGISMTTDMAHMPRQSTVNSDVKSNSPTGKVLAAVVLVRSEASWNSFQEVKNAKMPLAAIPAADSGRSMCQNVCQREQPSTRPASSSSSGTSRTNPSISHVVKGTLRAV